MDDFILWDDMNYLNKTIAFAFLFLFSTGLIAQQELVLSSMEGFAPYNYEKDGEYIGIDVEIVEAVIKNMGYKPVHKPRPWKRAVHDFNNQDTDVLFQLSPTKKRFDDWYMAGPIRDNTRVFVVRKDSPITDIKSLDDLSGMVVGTIRGFAYDKEFTEATNFSKQEAAHPDKNLKKLLAKRIDIIIENYIPITYYARKSNIYQDIRILPTPYSKAPRYVAFHKNPNGKILFEQFQEELDKLKKSGKTQEIVETWKE